MGKKLLAVLLAGAMVFGLAACGTTVTVDTGTKAEAEAAEAGEDGAEDRDITVTWSIYAPNDITLAHVKEINEEPCYADTGIKLEHAIYADRQTLIVEVAGGSGPDIMDLDGPTDVVEFIKAGQAVDLTPYAEKYGWNELFMDWALGTCMYEGKLYSLPTAYEGMGMFWNTDVLEANGWEIPETLDELEALYDQALEAGITPCSFGNSDYMGAVDWLYSTFLSCYCGGVDNIRKVLRGEETFVENEGTLGAMQRLADWYTKGYIDNNSQSITNSDMVARFAAGDALSMIDGTWASGSLISEYPECNWTFELMPAEKAGEQPIFPIAVAGSATINGNSTQPDAAAEVLNYFYSGGQAESHYKNIREYGGQAYPVNWFDTTKLEGMDEKLVHMYDVMNTSMKEGNIGFCSWAFYPADARVFMNDNTDSVFLGVMSVEDYLNGAQEYIDAAIADNTAPIVPD